ncbi:hypothetical protein SEPCBS57363_000359 [Sporothrix epigloea]|uniref:Iq calmodulin-binding motif protein n=1 Tax=Sporothrix epigloea TaxID=1892477 RepID=A0ABP0D479_9PEZI
MTITTVSNTTTTAAACLTTKGSTKWEPTTHVPSHHRSAASQSSVSSIGHSTDHSQTAYREYLDSLLVPSQGELERIGEIQKKREANQRHQLREQRQSQRRSLEACDRATAAASNNANGGIHQPSKNLPHSSASTTGKKESKSKKSKEESGRDGIRSSFFAGLDALSARTQAAIVIQRHYRGYRARREIKGFGISSETRWVHAIREAQYRELTRPRARSELKPPADQQVSSQTHDEISSGNNSTALRKWKKAAEILKHASVAQDTDSDISDDDDNEESDPNYGDGADTDADHPQRKRLRNPTPRVRRHKDALIMGLQYFLEMIDVKHRYGANLRVYHEEWKRCDTKENFFYWLDYGEGRLIDTAACPRERLDREQVRYLSREERQYYQVKIDSEGRLCWAKNGALIDTTVKYKDSIHGIVPVDDPTPAFRSNIPPPLGEAVDHQDDRRHHRHHEDFSSGSESPGEDEDDDGDLSESELVAARAAKYTIPDSDEATGEQPSGGDKNKGASGRVKKSHHFRPATIFDTLMRKSVQKNTWIFVADTSFRLYVGLKDSGSFQHSSFLQGARISAAGLIKIRKGTLVALSPLSGHYRPPVSNFRAFMQSLREEGVDMQHLTISKAYVVLVGLEAYMRTRQRGKKFLQKLTLHGHGHGQEDHADGRDGGPPADAGPMVTPTANTTSRLMQKLHLHSASHAAGEVADIVDAGAETTKI